MRSKYLILLLFITLACIEVSAKKHPLRPRLTRNDFPEDFIFGSATSAYQVLVLFIYSVNFILLFVNFLQICSVKVLLMKMVEVQVSGTPSLKISQVLSCVHSKKWIDDDPS